MQWLKKLICEWFGHKWSKTFHAPTGIICAFDWQWAKCFRCGKVVEDTNYTREKLNMYRIPQEYYRHVDK